MTGPVKSRARKLLGHRVSEHFGRPTPNIVTEVLYLLLVGFLIWAIAIGGTAKEGADQAKSLATAHTAEIKKAAAVQKVGLPAEACLVAIFKDVEPFFEQAKDIQSIKTLKDVATFNYYAGQLPQGGKCVRPASHKK